MIGLKRWMLAVCAVCALSLSNGCLTTGGGGKEECEASCDGNGEGHGKRDDGKIRGRDIAEKGKPVTLTGVLKEAGEEWAIVSNGKTYEVHFGKESWREEQGIELKEGKTVTIEGFKLDDSVVVCVLTMDGKKTRFRDKDGRPMWAGHGGGGGGRRGKK
jgi:hypothetical protein